MLWYALRIGLGYDVAMRQPMGYLLDLMSIEQIKVEGAEQVYSLENDVEYDPDTMDSYDFLPDLK